MNMPSTHCHWQQMQAGTVGLVPSSRAVATASLRRTCANLREREAVAVTRVPAAETAFI